MMDVDKKEKGVTVMNALMEGGADKLLKGLGKTSPDLATYVLEFIFGELYSRSGLELKMKQMLTVTILATLGNAKPQLAYHIQCALNIGITRQEILDIMTHLSGYAGFPAALNGTATAKEVFAERDQKGITDN